MASDPLVGKVLADRFEILERIGEGGTGVVYKARQITVDREIAIKVLGAHVSSDPTWVKRFQNEARAAARLHNPHTVQLLDFGTTKEGLLFIAMELLQGRSLRDELDRVSRMPPERALRILVQACSSLAEAHTQGIIHRDIKPDNLYLDVTKGAGDFVKVLDFSVAKMDDPGSQQTRAGIVFGTPAYMSPEQGRGAKLGPQSDIYGLGIVLYEMLSGKPPFDSKIPTEVVMMHLRDKPKPIEGLPEPLGALVMRTLDKDPSKRQQTCDELADECHEVLAALYPQLTPSGMKAYGSGTGRHGAVSTGAMRPVSSTSPPLSGGSSAPSSSSSPSSGPGRSSTAPPPAAPSGSAGSYVPPPAAAPSRAPAPGGEQRTMIADAPAPTSPYGGHGGHGGGSPVRAPSSGQATMALDTSGGHLGGGGQATMMLPDSQGVVAFALQQAEAARQQAARQSAPTARPTHWSFWAAWVVLGIGGGLAVHFALAKQALAHVTGAG